MVLLLTYYFDLDETTGGKIPQIASAGSIGPNGTKNVVSQRTQNTTAHRLRIAVNLRLGETFFGWTSHWLRAGVR